MPQITASIVLYNSDESQLADLINSLFISDLIEKVYLIDNSPVAQDLQCAKYPFVEYIKSDKNIGYGAGHNLALKKVLKSSKYHLVINPDVCFQPDELKKMIARMDEDLSIGQLMPKVLYPDGSLQYLCKLIPTPFQLFSRRFLIWPLNKILKKYTSNFDLRFTNYQMEMNVPYLSGCFMLFRISSLIKIGLFDERFFMYPEDIDITRRMHKDFLTIFYPGAWIIHGHNKESYRSLKMLFIHIVNLVRYFNKWGWFFDKERRDVNRAVMNQLKNQCDHNVLSLKRIKKNELSASRVSIITVCLNSANTIRDTLESVADQDFCNCEHIIVDGGSTDNTLEILKNWKRHPLKIITGKDKGVYDAMNKGISAATGDIVGILNSDDFYVNPFVLSKVVNSFHVYNVDCVFGDIDYIALSSKDKVIRNWRSTTYKKGLFIKGWHPPHPSFFVRREIYGKYGQFDLDFEISADFEIMLRFFERWGISSAYIPEVLVRMRTGGLSGKSFRNIFIGNLNVIKAFRKNGIRVSPLVYLIRRLLPKVRYVIRSGLF